MTPLQTIQLDMLKQFVAICDKLKLRYYLVCGSALGAVKYRGFIPWDDDIDVAMPRPDYQKFLEAAPGQLPEHLFLQNYHSDPEFPHIYSKLRHSHTTFLEDGVAHLHMHHGIYIDIFPLDGYPRHKPEQLWLDLRKKVYSWQQYCALQGDFPRKVGLRNWIFRLLGFHKRTAKTLARMEKMFCRYPVQSSSVWCNHGNWQGKLEYAPRSQYGTGILWEFAGMTLPIPEQYDAYLTQKYGAWRKDPPAHLQCSHHTCIRFSADQPYTDFL